MIRRLFAEAGPIALGLLALLGPDRAEGQVAFAPGIGTIPDGVGMTAVPAVSADRRYVRLSVNAGFQTVDGFTNVGIPFGVGGLGSGAGLGALGNLGGAGGGLGGGAQGGVAGAPMGMDGPASGPSPAASELAFGRPNPTAPVPVPAGDAPGASFDHSFRMAPVAGPARPSPRAARSARKKPSTR